MALDLAGLAGATPYGAIANAAASILGTPTSSSLTAGPVSSGPKVINVAGFGSRASGEASQSLTQPEPDRGQWFPSSSIGDSVPVWVLPAAGGLLLLAIVAALVRRK